jgi:hypothetical protein
MDALRSIEAMQNALKTARRMSDSVSGEVAKATQKIHPPGAIISMQLTEESLKPSPEPPAKMNHYITCVPSESFGLENADEFWCKDLERGGQMAGDGTLTTYMTELTGPGWERSIQARPHPAVLRSGLRSGMYGGMHPQG